VMIIIQLATLATIWFGGHLINDGSMQIGALTAFLSYLVQVLMAVMMATFLFVLVPRAEVCAERIEEVLDTETSVVVPERPVTIADPRGRLQMTGVEFGYPGAEEPVLPQNPWDWISYFLISPNGVMVSRCPGHTPNFGSRSCFPRRAGCFYLSHATRRLQRNGHVL